MWSYSRIIHKQYGKFQKLGLRNFYKYFSKLPYNFYGKYLRHNKDKSHVLKKVTFKIKLKYR